MPEEASIITAPVFPLNTVLFPRMPLPLQIFEPRYKTMLTDIGARDSRFVAALIEEGEEVGGVVESVHVEPGLSQQVRVPALAAWDVEDAGTGGEPEDLDETGDLAAVPLECEDRFVLEQVVRVEVRRPPFGRAAAPAGARTRGQKNTGSRYAPNTSSMAARISYSVQ